MSSERCPNRSATSFRLAPLLDQPARQRVAQHVRAGERRLDPSTLEAPAPPPPRRRCSTAAGRDEPAVLHEHVPLLGRGSLLAQVAAIARPASRGSGTTRAAAGLALAQTERPRAPIDVLEPQAGDLTGPQPQAREATPRSRDPGARTSRTASQRGEQPRELLVTQAARKRRQPPERDPSGLADSSRSSQSPSTRRKRKNERNAVRTVFSDRGENRACIAVTNSTTSEQPIRLRIDRILAEARANEQPHQPLVTAQRLLPQPPRATLMPLVRLDQPSRVHHSPVITAPFRDDNTGRSIRNYAQPRLRITRLHPSARDDFASSPASPIRIVPNSP